MSKLSFFALYIKSRNFSDYGPIHLQVIAIQQTMKDLSQTYSKFWKKHFEGNSEPIPENDNS